MDILATQAAIILGGTGLIGKFIRDPDERDTILPLVAAVLGIVTNCALLGAWDFAHAFGGLVIGGSVTGLYSVVKGDGRKKEEQNVPVRAA